MHVLNICPEQLSAISEFSGLGPLFKSSEKPVELTESETEYVVRCVKHTFLEHMIFQVKPAGGSWLRGAGSGWGGGDWSRGEGSGGGMGWSRGEGSGGGRGWSRGEGSGGGDWSRGEDGIMTASILFLV